MTSWKFGRFVPFIGLGYSDGAMHAEHTIVTFESVTVGGVLTAGTETREQLHYSLRPKDNFHSTFGFRIPFEYGGISLGTRVMSHTAVKFNAMVGF